MKRKDNMVSSAERGAKRQERSHYKLFTEETRRGPLTQRPYLVNVSGDIISRRFLCSEGLAYLSATLLLSAGPGSNYRQGTRHGLEVVAPPASSVEMVGRYHWSAGFLGDLPFPSPFYIGAAPHTPSFTLIGSQDLDSPHSLLTQELALDLPKAVHDKIQNKPGQPAGSELTRQIANRRKNNRPIRARCKLSFEARVEDLSLSTSKSATSVPTCCRDNVTLVRSAGFRFGKLFKKTPRLAGLPPGNEMIRYLISNSVRFITTTSPPSASSESALAVACYLPVALVRNGQRRMTSIQTRYLRVMFWYTRSPIPGSPRSAAALRQIRTSTDRSVSRQLTTSSERHVKKLDADAGHHFRGTTVAELLGPRWLSCWDHGGYAVGTTVATVAELLAFSPLTKTFRVQFPAESQDFRKWESCQTMPLAGGLPRGAPASPTPSYRRSILTSITLIGSQDLDDRRVRGVPPRHVDADGGLSEAPGSSIRPHQGRPSLIVFQSASSSPSAVGERRCAPGEVNHAKSRDRVVPKAEYCSYSNLYVPCVQQPFRVKAVHNKVSTSETNLRKKSLPLPVYRGKFLPHVGDKRDVVHLPNVTSCYDIKAVGSRITWKSRQPQELSPNDTTRTVKKILLHFTEKC
ncbi:hypothetical protein PR048_024656 [Dryococelus australis]|uniref:Uncharacterized protein n=1 Tax=Dryococelus australis TaxID=614101 RepID=A0ABQ9GP62_9NEOP|nr:hypothetical protein PR048_024656 [Dryococelus australis]